MRASIIRAWMPIMLAGMLAACGGGSSDSSTEVTGEVQVSVTAEPSPGYSHAWVTLKEVWFFEGTAEAPEAAGWIKFPLSTPVTVDLMALANGNLADAFTGLELPVGTYHQIRVFMVDSNQALTSSAQALGLAYNSQLDIVTDTGAVEHEPLELVAPNDGAVVRGTFTVAEETPLTLALNFNIDRDVKEFTIEGDVHYLLSPMLNYYNLAHVGAIVGQIDPADLASSEESNGAYNIVISAQRPDDDGYRQIERYTTVQSDGSFTLFPMFIKDDSNTTSYDVVVRGRAFSTVIVRAVPAVAGTGPQSGQNPTIVQSTPISLTPSAEYLANLDTAGSPTSQLLSFYQTISGVDAPYLMRERALNPFTGLFVEDLPLSGGPLFVGGYNSGQAVSFNTVIPEEGLGAYQPIAAAPLYVTTPADGLAQPVGAGAVESISLPALAVEAPASATKISGSFTLTTPGKYDKGYLVVSRYGLIVTAIPLDSILAENSGAGGSFTIENVPGGTESTSYSGGIYRLYARLWNSADPDGTTVRRPVGGFVDLRGGSVSNLALSAD